MIKITSETLKEAAKSVDELMTSASPEIKMLIENPHFAIGLCLVLHKEVAQLRNQLQQGTANENEQPVQPVHAAKQINPKALASQPVFQNQPESNTQSKTLQESTPPSRMQEKALQPEKEELFV